MLCRTAFVILAIQCALPAYCWQQVLAGEPVGKLASYAVSRKWVDSTGKFSVEGKLKFADKEEVQILQDNGKLVKIKLTVLCSKDQGFVQSFLEAEAKFEAENSSDNPFKDAGDASATSNMDSKTSSSSSNQSKSSSQLNVPSEGGEPAKRIPITKGAKLIAAKMDKFFWAAKPAHGFPEVKFDEVAVATELKKPFFASLRVMMAGKAGVAVVNAYQQGRGEADNYSRFVTIRASNGSVSDVLELKTPWKLMAISADGARIAAVRVEGWDKGNDIGLFRVTNNGLIAEYQFTAGGGAWDELHYVGFAAGNKLITISQKQTLLVWDLAGEKPKVIYQGNSGGALHAVLSPAGEMMALPAGSAIAVIDIVAAKVIGLISRENRATQVAFSSDGTKLAAYEPFGITIYSMESGQEIKRVAVSESDPNLSLIWLGQYLMVGSVVYDVDRSLPVWTYESSSTARSSLGMHLISAFGAENGTQVVLNRIPHDEAIEAAARIDPETIYAIRPGDSVSIAYNFGPTPPDAQAAIRKAVEAKIQKQGWKLSSSADNTITIGLEQGKQQSAEYYTREGIGPFLPPPGFGRPASGPVETVTFTPWTHQITIKSGLKQVYQASYVRGAPDNFRTKEGESTQAYVNRWCQPSPSYFENLPIPPHILKPEFQGGMGKSKISDQGLAN